MQPARRVLRLLMILMVVTPLPSCRGESEDNRSAESGAVVVTIFPLYDLARTVAGDAAEVHLLLNPGLSPHAYSPTPADIAAVRRAELIIVAGGGIDDWLAPALEGIRDGVPLVNVYRLAGGESDAFSGDSAANHDHGHNHAHDEAPDHSHGDHEHAHSGLNPHQWLVPEVAIRFVDEIEAALAERHPAQAAAIAARAESLRSEVRAVDREYRNALDPFEDRRLVTFHDAFTPLAEAYGLEVVATLMTVESSQVTAARLAEVERQIRELGVRAVFIEPQFNPQAAQRLGRIVTLRTLDPLGDPKRPGYESWPALMRANLEQLLAGLSENAAGG